MRTRPRGMQGGRALVPPLAEILGYGRDVAQDPKTPAGTSIPLDTVIGTGAASTEPVPDASPAAAPPPEPEPQHASPEVAEIQPEVDVYGAPFTARSYGGEFVWAECDAYVSKVMRIRASEVVVISTKNRSAMVVMLTGTSGSSSLLGHPSFLNNFSSASRLLTSPGRGPLAPLTQRPNCPAAPS